MMAINIFIIWRGSEKYVRGHVLRKVSQPAYDLRYLIRVPLKMELGEKFILVSLHVRRNLTTICVNVRDRCIPSPQIGKLLPQICLKVHTSTLSDNLRSSAEAAEK